MRFEVTPEIQKLIEERMRSGEYDSPEHVVLAGLHQLQQIESLRDWSPGELNALLAEGEESIEKEGDLSLDEAIAQWRETRSRLE